MSLCSRAQSRSKGCHLRPSAVPQLVSCSTLLFRALKKTSQPRAGLGLSLCRLRPTKNQALARLRQTSLAQYCKNNRLLGFCTAAPLTRCRAIDQTPNIAAATYYSQRATKGGLLISEATVISPDGTGYMHTPGTFCLRAVAGTNGCFGQRLLR